MLTELLLKAGYPLTSPVEQSTSLAFPGTRSPRARSSSAWRLTDHRGVRGDGRARSRHDLGARRRLRRKRRAEGQRAPNCARAQPADGQRHHAASRVRQVAELKLKFDATLDYQQDAIASVVDLFAELPLASGQFSLTSQSRRQLAFSELGVANPVPAIEAAFEAPMLANLRGVQERNGIAMSDALDGMHFSVEMETGPARPTSTCGRSSSCNKRYGFTKFVDRRAQHRDPRRRARRASSCLRDHLRGLYDNVPFDATRLRLQAPRPRPPVRDREHHSAPRDEHPGVPEGRRGGSRPDEGEHHQPGSGPDVGPAPDRVHPGDAASRRSWTSRRTWSPSGRGGHRAARPVLHAPVLGDAQEAVQPRLPARPGRRLRPEPREADRGRERRRRRQPERRLRPPAGRGCREGARAGHDQPRGRARLQGEEGLGQARRRPRCRVWRPPGVRERMDRLGHLVPAGRRGGRVHERRAR